VADSPNGLAAADLSRTSVRCWRVMANVLLTGASGFVGSNLVEALIARGDHLTCLVRNTSQVDRLQSLGIALAHGDVTDRQSLRGPLAGKTVVYHLAGYTKAHRVKQFYEVNGQGTGNVAQVCAEQPEPPVLVIVSSLAAAGRAPAGRPRTEADPPAPVSHYGRSKRAGELAARRWADRVPITIVRPPIVLGRADHEGLAMFRCVAKFGVHLLPGCFSRKFSVIDAADLAELLILAAGRGTRIAPDETDKATARGTYFAACQEDPSYAELGQMIAKALGRSRVILLPIPYAGVWAGAAGLELIARVRRQPLWLNLDKAREITAGSWTCSPRAAEEELGFSITTPLIERLRQAAQWYKTHGWL